MGAASVGRPKHGFLWRVASGTGERPLPGSKRSAASVRSATFARPSQTDPLPPVAPWNSGHSISSLHRRAHVAEPDHTSPATGPSFHEAVRPTYEATPMAITTGKTTRPPANNMVMATRWPMDWQGSDRRPLMKAAAPAAPSFLQDRLPRNLAFHSLQWHHLDCRLRDAEMRMVHEHLRRLIGRVRLDDLIHHDVVACILHAR